MTPVRRIATVALAAACTLVLVLGPAGPSPAAAAQDLKFWVPVPLTGPLAITGQAQQVGWQHAVDWINKNNGIRGRKIDISFYDDEYKVELGVAGFKKAVADGDVVFSGGDGTPFVRAISPSNNDVHKVLMSNTGAASDLIDTQRYKYHFLVGPTYSDMAGMLLGYVKQKQGSGAAPRVAVVYSASEFGRDPLEHLRARAKALGIEVVLEQETKWTEVDVTAHAIKVRNAKPDYVIFHGYAGNVWPEIVKLLRDYGVGAQIMGTLYGSHPDVVSKIGSAADGYLGTVSVNLLVGQSKQPMMRTIDEYLKTWKDRPYTGYANIGYMQSWATALILREVIGRAIDKGKPLNGDNLIAEINGLKSWDSGGVFGIPVSFENQRIPFGVLYRYSLKDGKFSVTEETPWSRTE